MDTADAAIKLGAECVYRVAVGFNTYESARKFFDGLVKNAYVCHIESKDDGKFDVWYR